MKSLLLLVFIPLLLINQQKTDIIPGDCIEIDYVGQHFVKPLIIYKKKSELEIIKQGLSKRFDSMKQITSKEQRLLTEEEKIEEVNSFFDFVITSKATYKKLINFIQIGNHLFTSSAGYEGYNIILSGKNYCISYKSKDEFFEELTEYLTIQNCDKHVIEGLNIIAKGPR